MITTSAIALLGQISTRPSRLVEVAVLVAANAIATVCRFGLLRALIARSGRPAPAPVQSRKDPVMTTVVPPGREADLPRPGRLAGACRAGCAGAADEAAWVRPVQVGLAALAAFVYLFNLTISGYANTYYSAAALAASKSWSAWFFGSFDAANFITVDKPPLATMLMGLSVRLFGLSSWSILLPEALAGVATVAPPVRRRPPLVRAGRGDDRRPGHGPHPGRRPDLPLQQSRRRC